jgi:hypothetical protein
MTLQCGPPPLTIAGAKLLVGFNEMLLTPLKIIAKEAKQTPTANAAFVPTTFPDLAVDKTTVINTYVPMISVPRAIVLELYGGGTLLPKYATFPKTARRKAAPIIAPTN